jgi:hypothetical protein
MVVTKIAVVWDVTPCSLVDSIISEESADSIFRIEVSLLSNDVWIFAERALRKPI